MRVNEYRKTHPRCRTCYFAHEPSYGNGWVCIAKNKKFPYEHLRDTKLRGCLCGLYQSVECDE